VIELSLHGRRAAGAASNGRGHERFAGADDRARDGGALVGGHLQGRRCLRVDHPRQHQLHRLDYEEDLPCWGHHRQVQSSLAAIMQNFLRVPLLDLGNVQFQRQLLVTAARIS
jgi:hypothetical protein